MRDLFQIPKDAEGRQKGYLASHSLGLPTKNTPDLMTVQLQQWAELGVDGWFHSDQPWYTLMDRLRTPLSRIVGAQPNEVVVMNSLSINLHLLLSSFYQPTPRRHRILVDGPLFPSDLYALSSHLTLRGYDPQEALVVLSPAPGEHSVRHESILEVLNRQGEEFALVFFSGVHFLTGQAFRVEEITRVAQQQGCVVGFDLAHAIGNIPLRLHDWNVDFAIWCHYKYLCGGPGSVGGAYTHARHSQMNSHRLAGWWGNDPSQRFQMHLLPQFVPHAGAAGWQVSTPSILSATPLLGSLEVLQNLDSLPDRFALTRRLREGLKALPQGGFTILTPADQEGCQLSIELHSEVKNCLQFLAAQGIVCDGRPPNVLRVTPVPAYSTEPDVDRFLAAFRNYLRT